MKHHTVFSEGGVVAIPKRGGIVTHDLSFRYLGSHSASLANINLRINPGSFVLVVGPTGCGKSTLLKTFNGLIPHAVEGEMSGRVTVDGKDTREHEVRELARYVGMGFQNPEAQLFSLYVEAEIMLGPWNMGTPKDELKLRVDEALEIVGMAEKRRDPIFQLSDGQKQKTAIASILAMKPAIIVLDEPTSNIDIESALEITVFLEKLNKEQGYTVILAEHRTGLFARIASRVVAMESGRIVADGPPEAVFSDHSLISRLGIRPIKHAEEIAYFNLQNIMAHLGPEACRRTPSNRSAKVDGCPNDKVVLEADRLYFNYSEKLPFALQNISFKVCCGEFIGLVGPNGAGKTTLAMNLIGLLRSTSGRVLIDGVDTRDLKVAEIAKRMGYVFQNPDYQLFTGKVSEEVKFGLDFSCNENRKPPVDREITSKLLEGVSLLELNDKHPYALSRGQRRRLALASVIALGQKIVIVDEPTTGQDYKHSREVMEILSKLCEKGCAAIVITHDIPLITEYATRIMVLNAGRIIIDAPTQEIARQLGCGTPLVCRSKGVTG